MLLLLFGCYKNIRFKQQQQQANLIHMCVWLSCLCVCVCKLWLNHYYIMKTDEEYCFWFHEWKLTKKKEIYLDTEDEEEKFSLYFCFPFHFACFFLDDDDYSVNNEFFFFFYFLTKNIVTGKWCINESSSYIRSSICYESLAKSLGKSYLKTNKQTL